VQTVQRLLARHYFQRVAQSSAQEAQNGTANGQAVRPSPAPEDGSFNIAIQDGVGAGQTVPHVHVHVIPRIRDVNSKDPGGEGDVLYDMMAREEGNVGGALWDRETAVGGPTDERLGRRPAPGGSFPKIEDCKREARSSEEMVAEAELYKELLRQMDISETGDVQPPS
jgi:bis(5'-adenosyl)-triphosphatase